MVRAELTAEVSSRKAAGSAQDVEWKRIRQGPQKQPLAILLSQFSGGIKVNLGVSDPIEICGRFLAHADVFHPPPKMLEWLGAF